MCETSLKRSESLECFHFLQDSRSYEGEYVNDQKDGEANSTHHNFDVTCTQNRFRRFCCLVHPCSSRVCLPSITWALLISMNQVQRFRTFWFFFQKSAESGHFSMARWTCAQLHHLPVPNCGNVSSSSLWMCQCMSRSKLDRETAQFSWSHIWGLFAVYIAVILCTRFAVHTISCKRIFISWIKYPFCWLPIVGVFWLTPKWACPWWARWG